MPSFQTLSALKRLGEDIRTARKRRNLSVEDFCARIGVTDKTLTRLERGDGGVRLEVFVAAFQALGEISRLDGLLDPKADDIGLVLDQGRLPERIRKRRVKPKAISAPGVLSSAMHEDDEGSAF